MAKMGDILQTLRNEQGLTQEEVAAALDLDPETVSRIERSERPPKRGNTYRRLVEHYGFTVETVNAMWHSSSASRVPPDVESTVRAIEKNGASRGYLESIGATNEVEPGTRVRPIPGGDDIAAGEPLTSSPDFDPGDSHQFLPGELFPWDDLAFFVRVRGNSMFPEFCDGDIVIGSPALRDQVESGDCVCVRFTQDGRFRGGRTLKRIRYLDDLTVRLESLNPSEKNVGEVRLTEIDEIGPCVMHIRALWKRHGYSVADLHKAHRVKAAEPKAPVGEEPQAFPDYDGPQPEAPTD